ncbi:glycosyltransferase, partial [Calderihabitans maritimus]
MARINVLHVLRPAEGGMKEHVLSLLRNCDFWKYNLMVACPEYGEMTRELRNAGATVFPVTLKGETNPFTDWHAMHHLRQIIQQNRVHVVHTHGARAGLVGRLAARQAQAPVTLVTVHNFIYNGSASWWKKKIFARIQRQLARTTDHHIAVSRALAREIAAVEKIPPEKISTIYNGIDLRRFKPVVDCHRMKKELGLNLRAPVVGVVARLIPAKGVSLFLQAAARIRLYFPDAQFVIVGDGPQRNQLEEEARRLNLIPGTVFTGFRRDVPQLLPLMNVFVVPSYSEGQSIGTLEAMAARRPVVATRAGG